MNVPEYIKEALSHPEHDMERMKAACETVLDCQQPDKAMALLLPVFCSVIMGTLRGPANAKAEALDMPECKELIRSGANTYLPAMISLSVPSAMQALSVVEEAAYGLFNLGLMMQFVASEMLPGEFPVTQAAHKFSDEVLKHMGGEA